MITAAALAVLRESSRAEAPKRLTVLAASSLTEVLPRVDGRPAYSFGGSDQLAFQIRQGAPADVFASASPDFTQALFREGSVERPRAFASNSLALAVPRSNPAGLESVFDLRRTNVKLVVGAADVPVGAYTRRVLKRLSLTGVLAQVVSEEPDAKSVIGKLALGEADAGFVYRTDVAPAADRVRAIVIPPRGQPQVRYEVAVVRAGSDRAAARRFVTTLATSERARRTLTRAGFGTP